MTTITCVCEESFEADVPESVELAGRSQAYERIFDGTFMTFACPHCGHRVRPDVPLKVTDLSKSIEVFVVPERDRNRYLLGLTNYDCQGRIVIGYAELVEKLKVYVENLDDNAVELIKYYLLVRAGAGADPQIYFRGIEDGSLVFDIMGLRDDEVGRIRIGYDVYEKAVAELAEKRQEEPYSTILQPPYVSICKVEIEES